MQSFVETNEAPHVTNGFDVFLFGVKQRASAVWGNLEETSLLPYPTGNVRRFRENDRFTGFSSEVGEVQFFQDADVVFCTLVLIVTTDDDITNV